MEVLKPGAVIGIFGGGQLGRMLALAAARLGFTSHIYSPIVDCPAAQVTDRITVGAWDDGIKLRRFARSVDIVTYEFENIPLDTVGQAAAHCPIAPNITALKTAQDRLVEKTFIRDKAGVAVAPFAAVDTIDDLRRAVDMLGLPIVLKTRRMGYDGKGQVIIRDRAEASAALAKLGGAGLIAEAFIKFRREVSIILARTHSGDIASYPLIENQHKDHILYKSVCPATGDNGEPVRYAAAIAKALGYVGVLACEFFELEDGSYMVNEIAPRVHNSGHLTQDAGCVDQFEQHIRAISGWPLGSTQPAFKIEMTNLIGRDILTWEKLAADPDAQLHIYGKSEISAGRKMGHVNRRLGPA